MKELRKMIVVLLAVLMIGGLCIPQTEAEAASTVKIVYKNKTKKYSRKKNSVYINGKKKGISKVPTFYKEGCYVGPASTIFKTKGLGVTYKDKSHKTLTLTCNNHQVVMTNGKVNALVDGKEVVWDTAPIYAKYKSSGQKRWIVPLKDVSLALGLGYKVAKNVVWIAKAPEQPPAAPAAKPKVVVVLDAGHGGKDSGAVANGNLEKNMNLRIVLAAKKYFDQDNRFQVCYTRTTDLNPKVKMETKERAAIANNVNADVFISVHINKVDNKPNVSGTETLYCKGRNQKTRKGNITSIELAAAMQKGALRATGFPDRGLVNRNDLGVLNNTNMPACLIEYGFISNRTDCIKMNANINNYGRALYDSLVAFMKSKGRIS